MRAILTIYFLFFVAQLYAQSLSDLNQEKDAILQLISDNNKLLSDYSEKKNSELMQISVIDDKIAKRKRLINIYNNQIFAYTNQVKRLSQQLDSLEKEIFKLKDDYKRIIYQQSVNKMDQNSLVYILSAKSFNESYRRFLYLKQFNEYKHLQADQIKEKMVFFNELKEKVLEKRSELDKLLTDTKRESGILETELTDRQLKVDQFTQHQDNLTQQISEAEKRMQSLEEKIVALIREEAEKAKKKGVSPTLSSDVTKNKGLLPWPCDKHLVVSTFGEHEHQLVPNLIVKNNGIDIDILDSKSIHPVHAGKVSRVIMIPGSNASVIIRNENVLTVYSNLSEVWVQMGEKVTTKTELGKVYNGGGINSNILHFEFWIAEDKQNPLDWLEKK